MSEKKHLAKVVLFHSGEYKNWERNLEHFRQENALLKYRLSEMVDNDEDNHFLQMAEYFQNELLLKDEMLKRLIKQCHELEGKDQKGKSVENINMQRRQLRIKILEFEEKFLNLSKEFNEGMAQHLE